MISKGPFQPKAFYDSRKQESDRSQRMFSYAVSQKDGGTQRTGDLPGQEKTEELEGP